MRGVPVEGRAPGKPLPRTFYARDSVVVARAVLGRLLVCESRAGCVSGRIVETEAYRGARDPASHAYRGRTRRNAVMFGRAGVAYVYFIYGVHHCLNLVTGEDGVAGAVLIRALAPVGGIALMRRRRGVEHADRLARGPGNLGRALGLTVADSGTDLVAGRIWISDRAPERAGRRVVAGPRIGIRVGVEHPWRFALDGDPCVSGARAARIGVGRSRRGGRREGT